MNPLFIFISTPRPNGTTEWRDTMEMGCVAESNPRELRLALDLTAGHYKGIIRTQRGQFPMETVHLQLLEWPTLKTVPCGPFDFDHTANTMTVPCFYVQIDDEAPELAWFDIPSGEMVEERFFETEFGFVVGKSGRHTVRLAWRDEEMRLTWDAVEAIHIVTDERQPAHCPVCADSGVWANAARWLQLRDHPTPLQAAIIDNLCAAADSGLDGTYNHRTLLLAILYRLGKRSWRDELRARALALAERRDWGFHDATGELGCNNDRDAGIRLMEMSGVLAWAADAFTDEEQECLTAKIRHHARILYRFTVVQKAYWPDTSIEAHGLGGWLGLATAAALLQQKDAEARTWLDWCYGNFLRNAELLPRDGFNPWPVFNSQWAVHLLALFEQLSGDRVEVANPFFTCFAPLLIDLHAMQWLLPISQTQQGALREEIVLAGYLGARNSEAATQAAAAEWAYTIMASGGYVPPLTLLFLEGGESEPAKAIKAPPRTLHSRSGLISTRDEAGGHRLRLDFICGSPQGPENASRLNRYNQFHNNMGFSGGYTVLVDNVSMIAGPLGGYDYRTSCYPLVSVDGGGHIMEHRYGGFRLRPDQQSHIRYVQDGDDYLYVQADLRPSYRPDTGLRRAIRHVWLLRGEGVVVVLDDFEAAQAKTFAHHLPTPGRFEAGPNGEWVVIHEGQHLYVRSIMPAGWSGQVGDLVYVPPYSMGLNAYKSREWQPEVHARYKQPPDFLSLTHHPEAPVSAFQAGVVLSLAPVTACMTPDGLNVGGQLLTVT